jgi:hypothetical protein
MACKTGITGRLPVNTFIIKMDVTKVGTQSGHLLMEVEADNIPNATLRVPVAYYGL